jgi:hypothetical protein
MNKQLAASSALCDANAETLLRGDLGPQNESKSNNMT